MKEWRAILGIVIVVIFLLFHEMRLYSSNNIVDDAFISFRYARHLATGQGLVWNPGEPPISGFTSLLYVVALAGLYIIGLDLVLASQLVGIVTSTATVVLTYAFSRQVASFFSPNSESPSPYWCLLAPALLALNPAFAIWARGGMETHLYTFLLLSSVYCLVRSINDARRWSKSLWGLTAGLSLFLAIQARPEAIFIYMATFLWFGLLRSKTRTREGITIPALVYCLQLIPLLTVVIGYRLYFGDFLPNTYYAKTGGGWFQFAGGISYMMNWLASPGIALWITYAFLGFLRCVDSVVGGYLALIIATHSLVIVGEGGDWMPFYRFVIPVLPYIAILTQEGMRMELLLFKSRVCNAGGDSLRRFAYWVLIPVIFIATIWPSISGLTIDPGKLLRPLRLIDDPDKGYVAQFTLIGKYFAVHSRPGDSIALSAAGAIPYYSGLRAIDMTGLNDWHIARTSVNPKIGSWLPGAMKGDGTYVLERKPTYILLIDYLTEHPQPGLDDLSRRLQSNRELFESPAFHQTYEFKYVYLGYGYLNYYELRRTND